MQPPQSAKFPKLGHNKNPKLEVKLKEEEEEDPTARFLNCPFLLCADLVLPWLTPEELATVSLSSKPLAHLSKTLTHRRTLDASRSFETLPIPFINTIDSQPYAYFLYTASQILSLHSTPLLQQWPRDLSPNPTSDSNLLCLVEDEVVGEGSGVVLGCGCESCDFNSECPCRIGNVIGEALGECGRGCGCGMECENRVSQKGVSARLKIVRVEKKGWALFADEFIKKGQFVCEYAGELLTNEEARMRQKMYDELATAGQFSPALLVAREYLPSRKACLRINIDATRVGNVARFINHSCDGGNLSTVVVRRTGALLPHLCFFASEDIKENTELSFSYGDIRVKSDGLPCFCGSSSCRGTLPSEHT